MSSRLLYFEPCCGLRRQNARWARQLTNSKSVKSLSTFGLPGRSFAGEAPRFLPGEAPRPVWIPADPFFCLFGSAWRSTEPDAAITWVALAVEKWRVASSTLKSLLQICASLRN